MSAWLSPVRTLSVAALVMPVLLLSGCSGDEAGGGANADAASSPSASDVADPDGLPLADLPEMPAVRKAKAALDDVEFADCSSDAGQQEVTGTVTNPTGKPYDYAITVSWTNDQSEVLARGVTVVQDVEGGGSADFEVGADVPAAATTCTYFVQRGKVV